MNHLVFAVSTRASQNKLTMWHQRENIATVRCGAKLLTHLQNLKPGPRKNPVTRTGFFLGAGEETLTLDLFLGKEAL